MGDSQEHEVQLHIVGQEDKEGNSFTCQRNLMWWIRMVHLYNLCSCWSDGRHSPRKIILRQRWQQQMVGRTFAHCSGEWKGLSQEMEGFKLGKVSYLMTLIWTAVCWQVFSIGAIGLIFEVSSVFSNVISTLGLPVVPVLAVVFFKDKMSGLKVGALILAVWGFVSYVYQHYLDDCKSKFDSRNANDAAKASIVERNNVSEE
ncbi:hypothetical protein Patl1_10126 [Pistacia atlantica]|uniref:Uncharacterized protein n=1 Tax=Pistacia atlantica TaxID=434234 RepID=A0ACC1A384_9ROSI|nr:hypothetical protein Patl1_10126 [Pistacia atlantica]